MSDKPVAGLVTAVAIAPLCLVCVLGPGALVAAGSWFLAWLGGFGLPLLAAALAAGGWFAWRVLQRRRPARRENRRHRKGCERLQEGTQKERP